MGKLRLEVLSEADIQKFHERTLDVLEKVGVRVLDGECQQVLVRAGAKANEANGIVCLAPGLVEEALAQAPSTFVLQRRDGKAIPVGGQNHCYCGHVIFPWIIDYGNGRPRRPTLNDVIRHTRLVDAHPLLDAAHRMALPTSDVSGDAAYVKSLEAFALNTTKHMICLPESVQSAQDWIEVAQILTGATSLVQNPILSLGVAMNSPLTFNQTNAAILKIGAKSKLLIIPVICPMAGMTSPFSFAGTMLTANCEAVFLVVMAQLLRSGTPVAYAVGPSLTDLRNGRNVYYNADKILWKIAGAQMGRFYNLPVSGEAGGSLVARYDVQYGIEQALLMLPTAVCGQNILQSLGTCYNVLGMSAETIVIQCDLLALLERISAGIDTSDTLLAFDSIGRVGPGGHFLIDELTLKTLRSNEFFSSGSFDRLAERGSGRAQESMLARAHERVEELLATHVPAVPEKQVEEVSRWARKKLEAVCR
jgi:trimethylamine--corrinoid protein Co-methyltransferase